MTDADPPCPMGLPPGQAPGTAARFADPFVHLPFLRDRVTPPERSRLRLTPDQLAQWDAQARARGLPEGWRQTEAQLQAGRRALLGDFAPPRDLWVFGYGSLMWDPGVHFAEVRRARLAGHGRRFCYRTILGRGTPEAPALMLALRPGGEGCDGLVFRLAAEVADAESALLWQREMIRNGYVPALHDVATPQGSVQALVFAVNTAHESHTDGLGLDDEAAIIATAEGNIGSNRDYLFQLAAQLAQLQVQDAYVEALVHAVQAHRGQKRLG